MALTETHHSDKEQAVSGALWIMAGYGGSQLLRLLSNLVLARLLFPASFGLMALVNVFMTGLQMISDIGLGPGIIRSQRGSDDRFLRTAWTMQVIRGIILWLIACLLAYPVSRFYGASNPDALQLVYILPIAALTALIGGFTSTSIHTLNRSMHIRSLVLLELYPQIVSIAVMVLWACVKPDVTAMVAGGISYSFVRLFLSHRADHSRRDHFGWDAAAALELGSFGRWILASTMVSFVAAQFDKIILGKLLTLSELGLYTIALSFSHIAVHTATRLSGTVLYPLLSRHAHNPERMMELCLRSRKTVLAVSGALCAAFCIGSDAFFSLLYPHNYAGSIDMARWICLVIWSTILIVTIDRVPLALGRSKALFGAKLFNTLLLMISAAVGYRLAALPGFILGMAAANIVSSGLLTWMLPYKRFKALLQSLFWTAALGIWALAAVGAVQYCGLHYGEGFRLTVSAVLGMMSLSAALPSIRALRRKKNADAQL